MIHYSNLENLNKYREVDYLSQSFLKNVLKNNTQPIKETVPMILGTYLDSLLFTPHLVNEVFAIGIAKRPSDTLKGFVDDILSGLLETQSSEESPIFIDNYKQQILEKAKDYQPKWGEDAKWNNIRKEVVEYWTEIVTNQGKMIITQDEHELSTQIASLTLSHSLTGKYFIEQKDVDKYFQLPLYWVYKGIPCKGLLDALIIDHSIKKIYVRDLKGTTSSNIEDWFRIARQKRYEFQLSFYEEGVKQNFSDLIKDGYVVESGWIVIPLNNQQFKPWVVPCTSQMLFAGKYGYARYSQYGINWGNTNTSETIHENAKQYDGWEKAISIYQRSKSEQLLDWDLSYLDYQGKLPSEQANTMFFI